MVNILIDVPHMKAGHVTFLKHEVDPQPTAHQPMRTAQGVLHPSTQVVTTVGAGDQYIFIHVLLHIMSLAHVTLHSLSFGWQCELCQVHFISISTVALGEANGCCHCFI